jgi:hypothetical protein
MACRLTEQEDKERRTMGGSLIWLLTVKVPIIFTILILRTTLGDDIAPAHGSPKRPSASAGRTTTTRSGLPVRR